MKKERIFFKNFRIYDDDTIETMKKYYNIDEDNHDDLLKYIKKNGVHHEEIEIT